MGAVVALSTLATVNPAGLIMLSPGFNGHPRRTFTIGYKIATLPKRSSIQTKISTCLMG